MMNTDWPNRTHANWRFVPRQRWLPFTPEKVSQTPAMPDTIELPAEGDWVVIVDGVLAQKKGDISVEKSVSWQEPDWPSKETLWDWNEAHCQSTVLVNTDLITIYEYYTGQAKSLNTKLHININAKKAASVYHKVLSAESCEHVQAIVQCKVGIHPKSDVTYYYTQQHTIKRLGYMDIDCGDESCFNLHTLSTSAAFVRDVYYYKLQSGVKQYHSHFSLTQKDHYNEQRVYLDHVGENITAHHSVRGIASDEAQSVHISQAIVRSGSVGCAVIQKLDFRSLGQAKIVSQPDIRVAVDAVQAAHGSTIAPFDQNSLHYLKTRGLDQVTATGLLTYAFARPLLKHWDALEQCAARDAVKLSLAQLVEVTDAP